MTETEVIDLMCLKIAQAGNRANYAAQVGVSVNMLDKIIRGDRRPSLEILQDLGLKKTVTYERIKK